LESLFLFDKIEYFETLKWLGKSEHYAQGSLINRSLPYGMQDARGSWPYQSLPTLPFLNEVAKSQKVVNTTTVIRPDLSSDKCNHVIANIKQHYTCTLLPLKEHLCHNASLTPAREAYSSRTNKRINLAKKELSVQRETFSNNHMVIAYWQKELQQIRNIPYISSPDKAHFSLLSRLTSVMVQRFRTPTKRLVDSFLHKQQAIDCLKLNAA
jgi:hypothetical protein